LESLTEGLASLPLPALRGPLRQLLCDAFGQLQRADAELASLPAANTALCAAALDLAARRAGVPLLALLEAEGVPCARVQALDALLASLRRGDVAAPITGTLKVKVGLAPIETEVAQLTEVRQLAPELELRLDANGAWSVAETAPWLAALAGLGLQWLEEPWADGLQLLRTPCPLPVAWDETLQCALSRDELARARDAGLRALVLKPTSLGLPRCLELLGDAEALGLEAIASHTLDGDFGLALGLLLVALGTPHLAQGLGEGAGEWETLGSWERRGQTLVVDPNGPPGLGFARSGGLP